LITSKRRFPPEARIRGENLPTGDYKLFGWQVKGGTSVPWYLVPNYRPLQTSFLGSTKTKTIVHVIGERVKYLKIKKSLVTL
jgi:hypothetical protein